MASQNDKQQGENLESTQLEGTTGISNAKDLTDVKDLERKKLLEKIKKINPVSILF